MLPVYRETLEPKGVPPNKALQMGKQLILNEHAHQMHRACNFPRASMRLVGWHWATLHLRAATQALKDQGISTDERKFILRCVVQARARIAGTASYI